MADTPIGNLKDPSDDLSSLKPQGADGASSNAPYGPKAAVEMDIEKLTEYGVLEGNKRTD